MFDKFFLRIFEENYLKLDFLQKGYLPDFDYRSWKGGSLGRIISWSWRGNPKLNLNHLFVICEREHIRNLSLLLNFP